MKKLEYIYHPHPWEEADFNGRPLENYNPNEDKTKISRLMLYMYVGERALKSILSKGRIKLSRPLRTNDFAEGVAPDNDTQEKINEFGYICLSSVGDSPAMWGHYADSGRGACLAFNFEVFEVEKDTYEILESGCFPVSRRKFIRKVQYVEGSKKAPSEHSHKILFQKDVTWENEEEYRILVRLHGLRTVDIECSTDDSALVEYYDTDIMENLETVILGSRCRYECVEVASMLRKLWNGDTYQVMRKWFMWNVDNDMVVPPILHAKSVKWDVSSPWKQEHDPSKIICVSNYMYIRDFRDFEFLRSDAINSIDSKLNIRIIQIKYACSRCGYEFYELKSEGVHVWETLTRFDGFKLVFVPARRKISEDKTDKKIEFLLFRVPSLEDQGGDILQGWLWMHDVNETLMDGLKQKLKKQLEKAKTDRNLYNVKNELFPESETEKDPEFKISGTVDEIKKETPEEVSTSAGVILNGTDPSEPRIGDGVSEKESWSGLERVCRN